MLGLLYDDVNGGDNYACNKERQQQKVSAEEKRAKAEEALRVHLETEFVSNCGMSAQPNSHAPSTVCVKVLHKAPLRIRTRASIHIPAYPFIAMPIATLCLIDSLFCSSLQTCSYWS